jgi:hypothetical protein
MKVSSVSNIHTSTNVEAERKTMFLKKQTLSLVVVCAVCGLMVGCSGVREHVRQYDFRTMKRVAAREKAAPSPIADVVDMKGWTSDFDGAMAFARANGQRTVVLLYSEGEAKSEKAKQTVESALANVKDVQKVALNVKKQAGIAQRLGASKTPAVVILDPSGRVISREEGTVSRTELRSILASQ